jgi:hypothetical protein
VKRGIAVRRNPAMNAYRETIRLNEGVCAAGITFGQTVVIKQRDGNAGGAKRDPERKKYPVGI